MNFQGAFRGLRNPMNSWAKSDSSFGLCRKNYGEDDLLYQMAVLYCIPEEKQRSFTNTFTDIENWLWENGTIYWNDDYFEYAFIGPKDLDLAQRMIKAGTSDRKFMRQIMVSVDITAPLYWWKEFDTYKVGTVANSTSTMHKLASTPITLDCFETDDQSSLYDVDAQYNFDIKNCIYMGDDSESCPLTFIDYLEDLRNKYNETKDKRYWKELIRWLPNSWLQTRTVTLNYEVLRNIYFQRRNHKLSEWHRFCDWINQLPYAKELITIEFDK